MAAVHEASLVPTRDLAPTESSLKQSVTRLTRALDDLQAQLVAGQDSGAGTRASRVRVRFGYRMFVVVVVVVEGEGAAVGQSDGELARSVRARVRGAVALELPVISQAVVRELIAYDH
ncbi:hypothetical protein [Streptomyces sp. NPDC048489]|uniref:hypothetical protein n=1 Tax=Streptomyces sp. NPDC048489 TaxID=3154504 RepID=UPI00342F6C66